MTATSGTPDDAPNDALDLDAIEAYANAATRGNEGGVK